MKITTYIPVLFIIASIFFFSCKKEEPTPPPTTTPNNNNNNNNNNNVEWNWTGTAPFSVKIESSNTVRYFQSSAWKHSGYITVTARDGNRTFSIVFPDTVTTGTEITLPAANSAINFQSNLLSPDPEATTFINQSVKIKIVSISDKEIEGKFYGTLKNMSNSNPLEIKEGYFKMAYY